MCSGIFLVKLGQPNGYGGSALCFGHSSRPNPAEARKGALTALTVRGVCVCF